jgi:hypothetical protein
MRIGVPFIVNCIQVLMPRAKTAAARVRAQGSRVGLVMDKVTLGQVFSELFGFPCQFPLHRLLHIHLSSGAGTIG